ncbi:MAG: zinc-ribbon domain-containing protein [Candidatus Bathyarchaeia archaeon]
MGLRERLARANWELNLFLKTGRFPRDGYSFQPSSNPHHNLYRPRTTPNTNMYNGNRELQYFAEGAAVQAARRRCTKCGSEVSVKAVYCHVCGSKIR